MSAPRFQRVLIAGAHGQLSSALLRCAPEGVECQGFSRERLDITNEGALRNVLYAIKPQLIINGAAYNLVDKAENEGAEDAIRVNALGVANLAKVCRDTNIPLVHFSTDYVFDGDKSTPYNEDDATKPLSVYGASKLAGENIALAESDQNWVVRVCGLFGSSSKSDSGSARKPAGNFPLLMLRLARERGSVRVVNDQIGCPTYTQDLARAVWQLLERSDGGLFQLCNAGEVAFDEYARAIYRTAGVQCDVVSVSSKEYRAAARRPRYSVLSNDKAQMHGVIPLRHWSEALREFLLREVISQSIRR